jgi:putative transposase
MARLPRAAVAGHVHLISQQGNNRQPVFVDDDDRRRYLELLNDAAITQRIALHAYALLDTEVLLLVTPHDERGPSRLMQALGRTYVSTFNRRHGRSGTLWEGRFRSAVIESERFFLACLRHVETAPVRAGLTSDAEAYPWSSVAHHVGRCRDPRVTDHSEYWTLGNTPFEREMAYRRWLEQGASVQEQASLSEAARKGWAIGSDAFVMRLGQLTPRRMTPRPRGRPRKQHVPI